MELTAPLMEKDFNDMLLQKALIKESMYNDVPPERVTVIAEKVRKAAKTLASELYPSEAPKT